MRAAHEDESLRKLMNWDEINNVILKDSEKFVEAEEWVIKNLELHSRSLATLGSMEWFALYIDKQFVFFFKDKGKATSFKMFWGT